MSTDQPTPAPGTEGPPAGKVAGPFVEAVLEALALRAALARSEWDSVRDGVGSAVFGVILLVVALTIFFLSLNVLVLIALWEHRLWVSAGLVALYLLLALYAWARVKRAGRLAGSPFKETTAVLAEDLRQIGGRS